MNYVEFSPADWDECERDDRDRRDERLERERIHAAAIGTLLQDMQDALLNDPRRVVLTPAFGKVNTAADVILDSFSGTSGTDALLKALEIIGAAARGEDVLTRAALWISVQAAVHARYHEADFVTQQLEGM